MEPRAVPARDADGGRIEVQVAVLPATPWRLVATLPDGAVEEVAAGREDDVFDAFLQLRRQLEARGLLLCVAGAGRDVWPSGQARQKSAGMRAYRLPAHRAPTEDDLVEILDPVPCEQAVPVEEQVRAVRDRYRHRPDEPRPTAIQVLVDTLRGLRRR